MWSTTFASNLPNLTCAHCVDDDPIELTHVLPGGKLATYAAEIVMVDEEHDLALLKVENEDAFKPVQLAIGHSVETGIPVSVIGHPGVGRKILDYTMTQGIVSNPRRDIEGLNHIQMSAAVNHGSSGSPMFDEYGDVIGMVVLKADIEGAGFAVPASAIAKFLTRNLSQESDKLALDRSWFDSKGKGPLEAKFLGFMGDKIQLKRASDGRLFNFAISDLSEADQSFLELVKRKPQD